ncbi:MAG: hypothetical protein HW419_1814 [Deltaproteobacteria bacterium]|nr:hypothetical protein [Deltaproteobacteria bacterium]
MLGKVSTAYDAAVVETNFAANKVDTVSVIKAPSAPSTAFVLCSRTHSIEAPYIACSAIWFFTAICAMYPTFSPQ